MKKCDICGTSNCNKSNYCIHCGNIINPNIYCPYCGGLIDSSNVFCKHCSKQVNPIIINDFDILFSNFNEALLKNYELSEQNYDKLLHTVFSKANGITIPDVSLKNQIKKICEVFSICLPKTNTSYDYGKNFTNIIYYDARITIAEQIGAMLHELAHVLLFEFILAIVCDIFQSERTATLESFVFIFVSTDPVMSTINEYYASTVESQFIPLGYENYNSYLSNKKKVNLELIHHIVKIANRLSYDVCFYLKHLIPEVLRREILTRYIHIDEVKSKNCAVVNDIEINYSADKASKELVGLLNKFYKDACDGKHNKKLVNVKNKIENNLK